MKIIQEILESEIFSQQPPVLVDIGASGEIYEKWEKISQYCICLAFDADDREFEITEETNKKYRKLIKINRIVTAESQTTADFYLTSSPFCSSLLKPDEKGLRPWIFNPLFKVEKTVQLDTITVNEALKQSNLDYVDWFKTDTQGTDLRLFMSLPEAIKAKILIVDLEPGIMDAYSNEDKLHKVMSEVSSHGFWLSTMIVKGVQRLKPDYANQLGKYLAERLVKRSPGWAEVTYLREPDLKTEREYLLLFIFSILEKQYGFAIETIDEGLTHFPTPLMQKCKAHTLALLNKNKVKVPLVILKRQIAKIFSKIND